MSKAQARWKKPGGRKVSGLFLVCALRDLGTENCGAFSIRDVFTRFDLRKLGEYSSHTDYINCEAPHRDYYNNLFASTLNESTHQMMRPDKALMV